MDLGHLIAIATALAAWVAIYLQRRQVFLADKALRQRVRDVEDLITRIEKERELREAQIGEAMTAHQSLDVQTAFTDLHARSVANDVFVLEGLLLLQQLAVLYARYSDELDERDPVIAKDFGDFCFGVIGYVATHNNERAILKGITTYGEAEKALVRGAIKAKVAALEKAHVAGDSLMRRLDDLKFIGMSDGTKLSAALKHISHGLDDLRHPRERLSKYPGAMPS